MTEKNFGESKFFIFPQCEYITVNNFHTVRDCLIIFSQRIVKLREINCNQNYRVFTLTVIFVFNFNAIVVFFRETVRQPISISKLITFSDKSIAELFCGFLRYISQLRKNCKKFHINFGGGLNFKDHDSISLRN